MPRTPPARIAGQGASLALEDAIARPLMLDRQELSLTFQNFEAERRPRAEKIVALARRNGNSKREFSPPAPGSATA